MFWFTEVIIESCCHRGASGHYISFCVSKNQPTFSKASLKFYHATRRSHSFCHPNDAVPAQQQCTRLPIMPKSRCKCCNAMLQSRMATVSTAVLQRWLTY